MVPEFCQDLFIPFIITSREKECFISPEWNQIISFCNHEKAETCLVYYLLRLILILLLFVKGFVVVCLIIWAYSKLKITNNWYLSTTMRNLLISDKYDQTLAKHFFFDFTKNPCLNRMWYHILFLLSHKIKIIKN